MEETQVAFQKYSKIPLGSVDKSLSVSSNGEWIVTEKVHGANFSLISRGGEVSFAKRTGSLPQAEDFFSFRSRGISEGLGPRCKRLEGELWSAISKTSSAYDHERLDINLLLRGCTFSSVREECDADTMTSAPRGCTFSSVREECDADTMTSAPISVVQVTCFGELYGGEYPHKLVPAVPGLRPIQRGVYYTPDIGFLAFDVLVTVASRSSPSNTYCQYLDFRIAAAACAAVGIPFVSPLRVGSLAEVQAHPVTFASTIAGSLHQLPPLEDNIAEGVVIRRAEELPFADVRALFKLKIPRFAERTEYSGWRDAVGGGAPPADAVTTQMILWEVLSLLTDGRLASVISKHGRFDWTSKEQNNLTVRHLLDDALQDLLEYEEDAYVDFARKYLSGECDEDSKKQLLEAAQCVVRRHIFSEKKALAKQNSSTRA